MKKLYTLQDVYDRHPHCKGLFKNNDDIGFRCNGKIWWYHLENGKYYRSATTLNAGGAVYLEKHEYRQHEDCETWGFIDKWDFAT